MEGPRPLPMPTSEKLGQPSRRGAGVSSDRLGLTFTFPQHNQPSLPQPPALDYSALMSRRDNIPEAVPVIQRQFDAEVAEEEAARREAMLEAARREAMLKEEAARREAMLEEEAARRGAQVSQNMSTFGINEPQARDLLRRSEAAAASLADSRHPRAPETDKGYSTIDRIREAAMGAAPGLFQFMRPGPEPMRTTHSSAAGPDTLADHEIYDIIQNELPGSELYSQMKLAKISQAEVMIENISVLSTLTDKIPNLETSDVIRLLKGMPDIFMQSGGGSIHKSKKKKNKTKRRTKKKRKVTKIKKNNSRKKIYKVKKRNVTKRKKTKRKKTKRNKTKRK